MMAFESLSKKSYFKLFLFSISNLALVQENERTVYIICISFLLKTLQIVSHSNLFSIYVVLGAEVSHNLFLYKRILQENDSKISSYFTLIQEDTINTEAADEPKEPPKEEEKVEEVKQEEPAVDAAEAKKKAALDKRK